MKSKETALKSIACIVLLFSLGITIWRGFQLPMKWAMAHWLVGYDFGFIKRGLIGALFRGFISPVINSPQAGIRIEILTTTVLFLFFGVIFLMTFRMLRRAAFSNEVLLTAALFFTSPYIVMSAHLNGYFDNISVLLTVLSINLIIKRWFFPAAIALTIGILIHEAILVIGIPSAIFAVLLSIHRDVKNSPSKSKPLFFILRLSPFFLLIATFLFLWIYQDRYIENRVLERQIHDYLLKFDCLDSEHAQIVSGAYAATFISTFKYQIQRTVRDLTFHVHIVQIIPILCLLLVHTYKAMSNRFPKRLFIVAVLVTISSFSMFLIAWDTSRNWTYPLITTMLTLWTVHEFAPTTDTPVRSSPFVNAMCFAVIIANIYIHVPLMCGRFDRFLVEDRFLLYLPLIFAFAYFISRDGWGRNPPQMPHSDSAASSTNP
jgi:hypothetical protein